MVAQPKTWEYIEELHKLAEVPIHKRLLDGEKSLKRANE